MVRKENTLHARILSAGGFAVRLTRNQWLIMTVLAVGIVTTTAQSQGPWGGGRGGPGGGGGRGGDFFFAILAGKDKDGAPNTVIDVSKVEAPPFSPEPTDKIREKLTNYMKSKGISGNILTKEQFSGYVTEVVQPEMTKNRNKQSFDFADANKDGKLSRDEVEASGQRWGRPSPLLERFDEFDKNKDGFIDPDEYAVYMEARTQEWQKDREKREEPKKTETASSGSTSGGSDNRGYRTAPIPSAPPPVPDGRPVVFRYGKLPTRDLPSWFMDLDKDKDGQVGLYEWRSAGKLTSEFKKYDLNGDGFITAEELLVVTKSEDAKDEKALTFARLNADLGASGYVPPPTSGSGSTTASKDEKSGKMDRWGGWGKGDKGKGGDKEKGGDKGKKGFFRRD
jgi:Ca2+-binding EF-hand superfamily protein